MNKNEIQEKLKNEENVDYINQIEYNNKKYIKTVKSEKDGIQYLYYELTENSINKVEDKKIIDYLKKTYECNEDDAIVY